MATHWLESFWLVLLSGPQLAGEKERLLLMLAFVTPVINARAHVAFGGMSPPPYTDPTAQHPVRSPSAAVLV